MATFAPTTPTGVFKTPIPHPDTLDKCPPALPTVLKAFDTGLALTRRAIAADAAVATWHGDPALTRFCAEAADSWALADAAFEAFRFGGHGNDALDDAAWLLLLLFADDGQDLDLLTDRCWSIRSDALTCAGQRLPDARPTAVRLWAAADLMDQLITLARDESAPSDMHADGLPSIGIRQPEADIDRADLFSAPGPDVAPT